MEVQSFNKEIKSNNNKLRAYFFNESGSQTEYLEIIQILREEIYKFDKFVK